MVNLLGGNNMRRFVALMALFLITLSIMAGPVMADAPVDKGGATGGLHTHHVHTGNDGCVDIDAVKFKPHEHGLHQGASSSGEDGKGPFHKSCADAHPE